MDQPRNRNLLPVEEAFLKKCEVCSFMYQGIRGKRRDEPLVGKCQVRVKEMSSCFPDKIFKWRCFGYKCMRTFAVVLGWLVLYYSKSHFILNFRFPILL